MASPGPALKHSRARMTSPIVTVSELTPLETAPMWTDIPTALLQAELRRRQDATPSPSCGSKSGKGLYNTPIHVFALFLILILSTLACSFPIIVRSFPKLPVPHRFLFLSRHFGTGVLIATAFVHLLPTAFVSLTDPCLPSFWNKRYQAMAGLIAMVSMLIVVGIEMFFATRGAGHIHTTDLTTFGDTNHERHWDSARPGHVRGNSFQAFPPSGTASIGHGTDPSSRAHGGSAHMPLSPMPEEWEMGSSANRNHRSEDDDGSDSDLDLDELDPIRDESLLLNGSLKKRPERTATDGPGETAAGVAQEHQTMSEHQHQQKLLLQCLLLEAGILFHSVFIGMALSVATGTSFIVLLVAISFHQTFEGLALGSRISALHFPPRSPKPWLMALAYGTTTPIGQAIGLLIHNMYDPGSQTGLLMVGTMNAISSGLLLFAGLVELLAEDFLSDESYKTLTGRRRIEACSSVVAGAALMALVGAWA